MSSRKTYFGIGVPGKDPDPTEKSPEDEDRNSDYSAPTVVDDAKVAEGLKQLRAWYQPDAGETDDDRESVADSPSEPTKLGMPYPRPTAVGHSTSDAEEPEQRSLAPDPMRGTMFGHDVHRPELDDSSGPTDALLSSTSEPTDGPPRNAETMRHLAWRGPAPGADGAVAPFADFLRREAARPRPPVGFPLSQAEETDSIAVSRRRITSNVLLVVFGATAIVTAVILGLRSGTPEPAPSEAVVGTPGATPPDTTAGDVVPPPSAGPGNVTKSAASPAPVPVVPAPPAPAAPRVTDVLRAPTARPAAVEPPARAAQLAVPRRAVSAAKAPIAKTAADEQRGETRDTSAAAETATATAEQSEARPSRNARDRNVRKPEREKSPEEKDPDSTLPPSEE